MIDPLLIVPTKNDWIKNNLYFEEASDQILDHQVCKLRTKEVASAKVLWRKQFIEKAIWEAKEDIKNTYAQLFQTIENVDQGTKFSY